MLASSEYLDDLFSKTREQEWFQKLISLESPHSFYCKKMQQNIMFEIDPVKIEEFYRYYTPKYVQNNRYHIISKRAWGMGKFLYLYVNDTGDDYLIEPTF